MKQMTFAYAEYAGKRKQARKELFLSGGAVEGFDRLDRAALPEG